MTRREPCSSLWLQVKWVLLAISVVTLALTVSLPLAAQVRRGSLSGTVYDPSGAVIAGAQISLKNDATQVAAQTVSNSSGFFYFAGVEPGSYTVKVTAKGFNGWEGTGVVFNQAENRTLSNISLTMSGTMEKMEVVAVDEVVPLATGESRLTLNNQMVTEMAIQGRDAAELIKIMPGMGLNTGLNQGAWSSYTTQTNSGPVGQYSASGGQPYGGLSMTTDGAQVVDPGNQGTQIANINQDMTQEVTILNATYGAENAKGPVSFQAIGKSGGKDFHGSAYLYTRNKNMNATDWWLGHNGVSAPKDSYNFPGFNVGGPVIIPGTDFNKSRSKLFFFTAYEYMKQQPVGALFLNVVPTQRMLGTDPQFQCPVPGIGNCGDFSQAYLSSLGLNVGNHNGTGQQACDPAQASSWWYPSYCSNADWVNNGGYIPTSQMDPNAIALAQYFPQPNRTATAESPYNFQHLDNVPVNRWEFRQRLDYNVTQSTRISGSFTLQHEKDINNIGVWWWPGNTVPYPTGMGTQQISRTANISATTVFSPTLTNDFTFGYAYFINPFHPNDKSKMAPPAGFPGGPFTPNILPQIPNMTSWGCNLGGGGSAGGNGCFPLFYAPSFPTTAFSNNAFGKDSLVPSISDNVSKVFGTHTLKFGFYWDSSSNNQTEGSGNWAQGSYDFENYTWGTTGNALADLVLGHGGYSQVNKVPLNDLKYRQISLYAQDQWKATRRLTLTYGLRADHEGQWFVGNNNLGVAVWDPASYNPSATDHWTGLKWHAIDSSVSKSGWTSPVFYYSPRVGVAFDVFGTGKTVLRGGFGVYRWQVASGDANGFDPPQNVLVTNSCTVFALNQASNCSVGGNGSIVVPQKGDNRTPYTQNWSFIVSQQMPGKSTLELQYQGNRTRDALLSGNGTNIPFYPNINKIAQGALFGADPITGNTFWLDHCLANNRANLYSCTTPGTNDGIRNYDPFQQYGQALVVSTHGSYSNYNAMMVSWQKQRGPVTFMANYTWSKVMGIRDGQSNNGNGDGQIMDPFNLRNNYAPLAYDHTQIFNVSYIVHLPNAIHHNAFLGQALNGWELAGISQLQSGAPIQPNTNGVLNAQFANGVGDVLGTDGGRLAPILICDPRMGLAKGQYFNPNCFSAPIPAQLSLADNTTIIPGRNGQPVWPYIHGPAYMNHDLSLYKTFKIKESKNVQFRVNAFNFLNHPLPQMGLTNDLNLNLLAPIQDGSGGYIIPTSCSLGAPGCNANPATDGKVGGKIGRRVMEFAVKFNF